MVPVTIILTGFGWFAGGPIAGIILMLFGVILAVVLHYRGEESEVNYGYAGFTPKRILLPPELQAALKDAPITPIRPKIEVRIEEAVIMPYDGLADCFLRVWLHNEHNSPCTISKFILTLESEDKKARSNNPVDISGFDAVHYWQDDDNPMRSITGREYALTEQALIIDEAHLLSPGVPREGWLRFPIPVPWKWRTVQKNTGEIEWTVQDQETGEGDYEEIINMRLSPDKVDAITLEATDPFHGVHSARKERPFCPSNRGIERTPKKGYA